jgi:hypothetical protein
MSFLILIFCCNDTPEKKQAEDTNFLEEPSFEPATEPLDCIPDDTLFVDLEITTSQVATAPRIMWSGSPATLVYTDATGQRREIDSHYDQQESVVHPLGLLPNTMYTAQLFRENEGITECSSVLSFNTGSFPSGFPEITIQHDAEIDDGLLLIPILSLEGSYITAFNSNGDAVWVLNQPSETETGTLSVDVALYDNTQNELIFNQWSTPYGADFCSEDGFITWADWGGEPRKQTTVNGLRVGMTILDEESLAVIRCENDSNGYDVDIISKVNDEGIEELWRATDSFPDVGVSPSQLSWVHTNYLHLESESTLLLSMETVQAFGALNLETRDFDWLLSGKENSGDFESAEGLVERPHAIRPYEDGYLIYNRGNPDFETSSCANIKHIELNLENHTATSLLEIPFEPCSPLGFFGDVLSTEQNIISIWSDRGQFNFYTTDGESQLQVNLPLGFAFTFGTFIPWADIESQESQ